jgi:hypothetical protein
VEKTTIKGEEVVKYTVEEFIRATRPDGLGQTGRTRGVLASGPGMVQGVL